VIRVNVTMQEHPASRVGTLPFFNRAGHYNRLNFDVFGQAWSINC